MPPGGQFAGERFRCRRQPFAGLFLEQVELSERGAVPWTDFVSMGPTQSGKTTTCALIPMLYALFELKENVIFGVPTMKLAGKKWKKDIKPIIEASRYAHLMPAAGPGSQGGNEVAAVYFRNGTSLLFMTTGGGREERSSDTARWLIVTEADSFSETDDVGGEGRKIDQLIARTHSFGHRRRVFAECTVTTDDAFVWDTYRKKSSESVIVSPCDSCGEWIRPERSHLMGWQEASTQLEAGRLAKWMCEKCGVLFDEQRRQAMVSQSKLLHRGQTIGSDGAVSGAIPETRTFGFRWNAFDNRLSWTTSFIAETEFATSKAKDQDAAGIMLGQFYWAMPRESESVDLIAIDADKIQSRVIPEFTRGLVPADAEFLTMGIDVGKHSLHWTLESHRPNEQIHVTDYGLEEVPSDRLAIEAALAHALRELRERVIAGWPVQASSARMIPEQVFVDSGWGDFADLVYAVCKEFGVRFRPIKGFGFGQGAHRGNTNYTQPKSVTTQTLLVGNGWHLVNMPEKDVELVHIDADHWKTRLQTAVVAETATPGSFSLFEGHGHTHRDFKAHLCSEVPRLKQAFVDGIWKVQEVWERTGRNNHLLDSTSYGLAAADFVRFVRAARGGATQQSRPTQAAGFVMPDGREFFVGARA